MLVTSGTETDPLLILWFHVDLWFHIDLSQPRPCLEGKHVILDWNIVNRPQGCLRALGSVSKISGLPQHICKHTARAVYVGCLFQQLQYSSSGR